METGPGQAEQEGRCQHPGNGGAAQGRRKPAIPGARQARIGQRLGELRRGLPAVGGNLLQRAGDGGIDMGWDRPASGGQRGDLVRHDLLEDGLCRGAGERRLPGQHLVQDHAESVDVGPRVEVVVAGRLLRTHVLGRAQTHARPGQPGLAVTVTRGQRDAEVGHQRPAIVKQHVVRLDVAVDHALAVGIVQRGGDLAGDANGLADGQLGFPAQPGAERFALDVGHDVEDRAVDPAGIEQGQDVGVLEVGGGLDLLQETPGADDRPRSRGA